MPEFHPLRIASVTAETRDAIVVTFDVPDPTREDFRFTPGQHLTLRAHIGGAEIRRSYSICSAPHDPHLRIAIKRVQDGVFSTWANRELRPGHTIDCMPPAGNFHVAHEIASGATRHYLAFAAGSGITPILSILRHTLATEPRSRVTLVYGNRSSSSVLFKEELENLKDRFLDRLVLVFILSREHQDAELFNGRIDAEKVAQLLKLWIDPTTVDLAYICGPQSMMESVASALTDHGIAKDRIRTEYFGTTQPRKSRPAPAAAAPEARCKVTVIQDGRRREFTIARSGSTVLDSALEQGVDLPYSCKGGVCSTCRTKLIEGEVDMDINFALEDYEVARGFILTCQSFPLTPALTLDYDQES